jgi:hypothetical protein
MDAKHEVLRPAKRAGPGRYGTALNPWLRGDAKIAALISSVPSVPLWGSVLDQFAQSAGKDWISRVPRISGDHH